VLLLLLAACSVSRPPDPGPRINLCYSDLSGTQSIAVYAYQNNLFRKHGLDVNLVYIDSGGKAVSALIGGSVDFCQVAGAAAVNAAVAGQDVVFIGGLFNTCLYSLVVRPEIRNAKDLRGKTIAISRYGSSSDIAARKVLSYMGLIPDREVALMQIGGQGDRLAAMGSGAIAGTLMSLPWSEGSRAKGYHSLFDMAGLNLQFQHTAVVTTSRFAASHPQITLNIMKAFSEAISRMKQDREGTIQFLANLLLLSPEENKAALNNAYDLLIEQELQKTPYPTAAGVQTLLDVIASQNSKASEASAERMIDARFVQDLEKSGFIASLYR
jgi:NitT/TauT family transport system substrate-binding protein